jgi:hypothetical protein
MGVVMIDWQDFLKLNLTDEEIIKIMNEKDEKKIQEIIDNRESLKKKKK